MVKSVNHLDTRFPVPISIGGLYIVIKLVSKKYCSHYLGRIIMFSDGTLAVQTLHIFGCIINIILESKSDTGVTPALHFALPPCCSCWLCGNKAYCNKNFLTNFRGNGTTV